MIGLVHGIGLGVEAARGLPGCLGGWAWCAPRGLVQHVSVKGCHAVQPLCEPGPCRYDVARFKEEGDVPLEVTPSVLCLLGGWSPGRGLHSGSLTCHACSGYGSTPVQ